MIRNRIYRAANLALSLALIISIVAVGGFAISLTHISASVTVTFGQQPRAFAEAVSMADLKQFAALPVPVPQHKPR
jgi:hypothetical protein